MEWTGWLREKDVSDGAPPGRACPRERLSASWECILLDSYDDPCQKVSPKDLGRSISIA
jgi:hypothetical protein